MTGRNRKPHLCLVMGCERPIPRWKRLCDEHFRALPFDQRKAIAEAGQAKAPHIVADLTRKAAAWIEEHKPAAVIARQMGEAAE